MDQALGPDEQATFEAHLATCAECHDRSRLIREWSGSLTAVLEDTDSQVKIPERLVIPRRANWRAAAAIILFASALAVPPVRAWIIQTGGRMWSSLRHLSSPVTPAPAPVAVPKVLAKVEGPEFTVL